MSLVAFQPIPIYRFMERTGLSGDLTAKAAQVISLRQMTRITDLIVMTEAYLEQLLRSVRTADGQLPYRDATISIAQVDPATILLGQTFIERRKYISLLENLSNRFSGFCFQGSLLTRPPLIIYGRDENDALSIAHYVPPIVENNHALLDGTHRGFIANAVISPFTAVMTQGVRTPFPCDLHGWESVKVVETKPPVEERFDHLRPELFRQLKEAGIDG